MEILCQASFLNMNTDQKLKNAWYDPWIVKPLWRSINGAIGRAYSRPAAIWPSPADGTAAWLVAGSGPGSCCC